MSVIEKLGDAFKGPAYREIKELIESGKIKPIFYEDKIRPRFLAVDVFEVVKYITAGPDATLYHIEFFWNRTLKTRPKPCVEEGSVLAANVFEFIAEKKGVQEKTKMK